MLFHVAETFRRGPDPVGERFRSRGRLMPDGAQIETIASWMSVDGGRCFMIVAAPTRAALDGWTAAWSDLVEFEITEIVNSADFWRARASS